MRENRTPGSVRGLVGNGESYLNGRRIMQQTYIETRSNLKRYLVESGVTHHMFYGPTTDRYWSEPFKLVAVNMEPYGYEKMGLLDITRDDLVDWIYDAGGTRTKTARYTLTILGVALECFQRGMSPSREMLSRIYSNDDVIEDTLDRTVYYNIRPQSNSQKPQDYAAISSVGASELGRHIWAEIKALKPNVIFVGGQAGLSAVNQLIAPSGPVYFRGSEEIDGCLVSSIPHPSRPAYDSWCAAIQNALSWMNQKKK